MKIHTWWGLQGGGTAQLTRILPITAAVPPSCLLALWMLEPRTRSTVLDAGLAQSNSLMQGVENLSKDPSSISCLSPGSIVYLIPLSAL